MTKSSHSQYLLQGAGLPCYFFISDSVSPRHTRMLLNQWWRAASSSLLRDFTYFRAVEQSRQNLLRIVSALHAC